MRRPLSPLAKLGLVAEILGLYTRARWRLWRSDLPHALASVRADSGIGSDQEAAAEAAALELAARLARAVTRTLPLLPAESRCLMQSLVLSGLLARRRIPSALVIGVTPGASFGAHAWVELAGTPVLPPGGSEFERLVEL